MSFPTPRATTGVVAAVMVLFAGASSAEGMTGGDPQAAPASASAPLEPTAPVAGLPAWQARASLGIPRDDFGTAVVGKEIWILGGMSGDRGSRLDTIEIYDTRTDSWRFFDQEMPEGLASFEATAIGDKVYVFGGLDGNTEASDFSAVLDTSTGKWRKLAPLPEPRYAHTVTLHDGLIYVIGGEGRRGPVKQVDIYHPDTGAWSTGAPMPKARGSHDAVSVGDVLYVLGGWLGSGPTGLVQTYAADADRWALAERLPEPVSRAGAAVLDGRVWVSFHKFSSVLDPDDGTWSPANPLTVSRHGLGYVTVGSRIYGIGGCTETPLRDVRSVDVLELT